MKKIKINQVVIVSILIILVILTLLPFYMTIMMSQKTNGEIINHFWALPKQLHPEYYTAAWKYIKIYIFNSIIVGAIAVTGITFLSSLSGYVFARLDFPGKRILFLLILVLMMVPGIMTLIPSFLWYKEFPFVGGNNWLGIGGHGFLNTRWVLCIPYIAGGQIFGIFLCRTFFENIPSSLFEAARIDGASELQIYFRIALPLVLPIIATLAILNFVGVYNDYIWPLITVSNKSIQTFSVGVTKFTVDGNLQQGEAMAGYMLGSIPLIIVFIFGMKYYIQGITQGAIKG